MDPINIPPMLAYIPAPWILWVMIIINCLTPTHIEHWKKLVTLLKGLFAQTAVPTWNTSCARSPTTHFLAPALIDEATMHGQESARSQLAVILRFDIAQFLSLKQYIPRCSMYSIFTYIWLIYGVNIGKYSIHGAYRICWWLNVNLWSS